MNEMAKASERRDEDLGLGMGDPLWTVQSIRPYVLGGIEAFGVDRVVFGTNWPVDRMFSSYPDVINAYIRDHRGFHPRGADQDVLRQRRTDLQNLRTAAVVEALASIPLSSVVGVHHVGMTVASLEKALAFWESFLGKARALDNRP